MFQAGVWTANVLAVLHASVLRALCEEERGESLRVQTCPSTYPCLTPSTPQGEFPIEMKRDLDKLSS